MARDEGEGFADASAWRATHKEFWSQVEGEVRAFLGDTEWHLTDAEPVVVEWFRVVERLEEHEP